MTIGWSRADIPDHRGRIAVVTGASSGIGLETTRALVAAGATVVMACRDEERGRAARSDIDRSTATGEATGEAIVAPLELTDPGSIERFGRWFTTTFGRLDILVNNAGVMACPPSLTATGVERQWATNHLGHFALTGLLLPAFVDGRARVVTVSSLAATGAEPSRPVRTDLDHYARFPVYRETKLANQVFAAELNHRLAAAGSRSISVAAHPGVTHTNLAAGIAVAPVAAVLRALSRLLAQSAADGALPILRAATDPRVEGGQYYGPVGPRQRRGPPEQVPLVVGASDRSLGRALWQRSMELSGVRYLAGP